MHNTRSLYRLFFVFWFVFWGQALYKELTAYRYIDLFFVVVFSGMILLGVFLYFRFMKRTARMVSVDNATVKFTTFGDKSFVCARDEIAYIGKSTRGSYIKLKSGRKILLLNSMLEIETEEEGVVKRNLNDNDLPEVVRKVVI